MNYMELEDRAIRKIVGIENAVEKSDFVLTNPRDASRRTMIDHYVKAGQLESPLLTKALTAVASAESGVRKARLSNLNSSEKRRFEKKIWSDLIRGAETQKAAEIKGVMDDLFKMKTAEKPSNYSITGQELLKLQKLQLQNRWISESESLARMVHMQKYGYDETELLVLSAISEKAARRAKEVQENLPATLANDEGLKLIKKLETLLSLHAGEIGYSLKSAPGVTQVVHVADLLMDVEPKVEDLAPTPAISE